MPPNSNTAARLAELRHEMKANKQQIQALTEAYSAVQSAALNISSTQEMLKNLGSKSRDYHHEDMYHPEESKR
ncbi:hypothetical protein PG991_009290 [Apiospora marii]|uniref:Uncharacterized protein n=1 Tax=Apiospora marii TaxID=335849 RepID=A0ABR1RK78_9PEZI